MPHYLVEIRAYFEATRVLPIAEDLAIEGWQLDGMLEDQGDPDKFSCRAEQDVRLEADDAGDARLRACQMASPILPSNGWVVDGVKIHSDLIIDLDVEHGTGPTPGAP